MRPNVQSRLGTDTPFIKDLIADIKKGEIKIPQFQRKFVWKDQQAFELLDSIANNYPIGSLLLWRTNVKLAAERNIGDFKLPETDDLTPTDYVLDGQQRITVVYSCLGAPPSEEGFSAAYDIPGDTFVPTPASHEAVIFPLRWMFDTTRLLDFRTGLKSYPNQEKLQQRLDSIINAFTNYRVPVVTLKELSIEEVCPIFERINSSGTKLSIYDLMVAATWSQEFDLNEQVDVIARNLTAKGFGEIEPNTILKCLTAIAFGGIKKDQILSLRNVKKPEMDDLVQTTNEALQKAVDLLCTEFKIYSWNFLPYEALLIVLCYTLANQRELTSEMVVRIRQWFWRASFSERYRVGGESFVSKDLGDICTFVVKGEGDPGTIGEPPSESQLKGTVFRANNSRVRAFILALGLRGPLNLTNGLAIDITEALSSFNRKEFHHIYPRAYLKRICEREEHNSLMNICMLASSENKVISDEDPNVYIPSLLASHNADANKVLASNLMPNCNDFDYKSSSYSSFLDERARIVALYARELCDGVIARPV